MSTRPLALILPLLAFCFGPALADQSPKVSGMPTPSEAAFVTSIQADLGKRFPTAADAVKAGYVRYTNPDDTGAISYANMVWVSTDAKHPSQLWYDKNGKLLGADFSVSSVGTPRPHLFGVQPGRWYEFDDHIHYVAKDAKTGKLIYDKYVLIPKFVGAGGDPKHPQAATLVKMHLVPATSDVATIFDFPSVWDLIVWVTPNPLGAFAEKNPLVKP